MYTLLINENNEIITTVKERIMQRSKLVDNLHFLMSKTYKGIDMSDFTVTMEYILPVSREYKTETLVKSDELYKEQLQYKLPFDTDLTKEAGKIDIQLTFTRVSLDAEGNSKQQVRKAGPAVITIVPISAWSDIIPDSALTSLDQRILMTQAMIEAANDTIAALDMTKADNIVYNEDEHYIQLIANGQPIGNKIELNVMDYSSNAIQKILIDDSGNLIAIYNNGSQENIGKINDSNCVGVYVPSLVHDKLTFTLQDSATDKEIIIDIDPTNEWIDEGTTNYIWEYL